MRRDRGFLLFLAIRPVSGESVKLTANLAQHELPVPSLADVGYLLAIPLAVAAMLAFPGRAEWAALQARSLLDGAVIATSLLHTSWSLVLGPVFRAGQGSVLEQAILLAYPTGEVVLVMIVLVVVARIRVGGAPVLLLGAGLLIVGRQLLTCSTTRPSTGGWPLWWGSRSTRRSTTASPTSPTGALFRERVATRCAGAPRPARPGPALHRPGRLQDGQRPARPCPPPRPAARARFELASVSA